MSRLALGLASVFVGALSTAPAAPAPPPPLRVEVEVDWAVEKVLSRTAATVEVDVMPFLGRADWGGPFNAYYEALANLGSEYVRYSPWFPNPRVVVAELTRGDCTKTKPATNWNSTVRALSPMFRPWRRPRVTPYFRESIWQCQTGMPFWNGLQPCESPF